VHVQVNEGIGCHASSLGRPSDTASATLVPLPYRGRVPTPDFVLELRRFVGTRPLPLVGVTAVVEHDGMLLLGRRSDNGALTPVTGIVDPGEEPADAAVREAAEEAGVVIVAERLASVHQIPRVTYENGDQSDYLDLTFRCRWISGDPFPADGEMTDVAWYPADPLPAEIGPEMRRRITAALAPEAEARFEGGR
jgi:ADP-ribose pyrophosphatase YjhB (NUDIX family)